MISELQAFNLTVLKMDRSLYGKLGQVTSNEVWASGSGGTFHPDGLYSNEIFGVTGTERRMTQFGYIDLKVPILNPVMYKTLVDIRKLYGEIMGGSKYGVYNPDTKDVELSTPLDGDTGYNWMVQQIPKIDFNKMLEGDVSETKLWNLKLFIKEKDNLFTSKFLVIPAGLRDYVVNEDGRISTDEINTVYRRIMALSGLVVSGSSQGHDEVVNKIQLAVVEVYTQIIQLLDGKHMFILGKFAKRAVHNGTRNVLTSLPNPAKSPDDPDVMGMGSATVGLYQYMKAFLPVVTHALKTGWILKAIPDINVPAILVDKTSLKSVQVSLSQEFTHPWTSEEGLEDIINMFGQEDLRQVPIEIGGYYLGLIYKDATSYRLFQSIDELPDGYDRGKVSPVTLGEFLYLNVYKDVHKYRCIYTRYPITGLGSTAPGTVMVKTTISADSLVELDDNWQPTDSVARQFPTPDIRYFSSTSVSVFSLKRMGADFDGDTVSFIGLYTEEAIQEIDEFLSTRQAYVDQLGDITYSGAVEVITDVVQHMTL